MHVLGEKEKENAKLSAQGRLEAAAVLLILLRKLMCIERGPREGDAVQICTLILQILRGLVYTHEWMAEARLAPPATSEVI